MCVGVVVGFGSSCSPCAGPPCAGPPHARPPKMSVSVPALQTPPKFNEDTQRQKERKWAGRGSIFLGSLPRPRAQTQKTGLKGGVPFCVWGLLVELCLKRWGLESCETRRPQSRRGFGHLRNPEREDQQEKERMKFVAGEGKSEILGGPGAVVRRVVLERASF